MPIIHNYEDMKYSVKVENKIDANSFLNFLHHLFLTKILFLYNLIKIRNNWLNILKWFNKKHFFWVNFHQKKFYLKRCFLNLNVAEVIVKKRHSIFGEYFPFFLRKVHLEIINFSKGKNFLLFPKKCPGKYWERCSL